MLLAIVRVGFLLKYRTLNQKPRDTLPYEAQFPLDIAPQNRQHFFGVEARLSSKQSGPTTGM